MSLGYSCTTWKYIPRWLSFPFPSDRLLFTVLRAIVDATVQRSWKWLLTIWMSCKEVVTLLLGSRLKSFTLPVCTYFAQRLWILKCSLLKSRATCLMEVPEQIIPTACARSSSPNFYFLVKDNPWGIHFYRIWQIPCCARGTRAQKLFSHSPLRMDGFVHEHVFFSVNR